MADAGFYRGTSSEQDSRFTDKERKLLKQMRFEEALDEKVMFPLRDDATYVHYKSNQSCSSTLMPLLCEFAFMLDQSLLRFII